MNCKRITQLFWLCHLTCWMVWPYYLCFTAKFYNEDAPSILWSYCGPNYLLKYMTTDLCHLLNFIRNSAWILPLLLNKLNSTVSCINYAATWKTNPGFRSLREFLTYGAFATLLQLSSKNIKNRMIAQFFVFFCCCKAHFQFSSELIQNNISCCVRRWWWWWKWQN